MSDSDSPSLNTPMDRVLYMMARLRNEKDGCPWDIKQTFQTIVPYTIEEAYEVAEAIENNDLAQIRDELGDLLLQVVFHSQIAKDEGAFEFGDVADGLVNKMLRRHPHVFPDGTLTSRVTNEQDTQVAEVKSNWEAIKKQEQQEKGESRSSYLDGIPSGIPGIARAIKLQKKAAKVGFDWPSADGAVAKLSEEMSEFTEAFSETKNRDAIADELGDLMFTCVNIARLMNMDADAIMRAANRKFETRFRQMEQMLSDKGETLSDMQLADMESAWQEAKREISASDD